MPEGFCAIFSQDDLMASKFMLKHQLMRRRRVHEDVLHNQMHQASGVCIDGPCIEQLQLPHRSLLQSFVQLSTLWQANPWDDLHSTLCSSVSQSVSQSVGRSVGQSVSQSVSMLTRLAAYGPTTPEQTVVVLSDEFSPSSDREGEGASE